MWDFRTNNETLVYRDSKHQINQHQKWSEYFFRLLVLFCDFSLIRIANSSLWESEKNRNESVFKRTLQRIKMQKKQRWTCFLNWCKWAYEILKARLDNPQCPERFRENTADRRKSAIFFISHTNVQCTHDDVRLLKNCRDRKNWVVERQCYAFRRSKLKGWTTAPQSSVFSGIHARKKRKLIYWEQCSGPNERAETP